MKLLSHYIEHQKELYQIINWKNHVITDMLFYSFRDTAYDRRCYPSKLHYHDYYELVIFEQGDIRYVCEGRVYHPSYGDIILIPPGNFHMSVINCESTRYRRHVFYLYPSAFDGVGHRALASFLEKSSNGNILAFSAHEDKRSFMGVLNCLQEALAGEPSPLKNALGLAYVLQAFYLLNQSNCQAKEESTTLPETILMLQEYIDQNFHQISSVSQIAEHFFYSREYVSRLFRKHFDTTISDYIMKRRIAKSQALMAKGLAVTDAAYEVGFRSLSTFIRSFRAVTSMTPSEYRKTL